MVLQQGGPSCGREADPEVVRTIAEKSRHAQGSGVIPGKVKWGP